MNLDFFLSPFLNGCIETDVLPVPSIHKIRNDLGEWHGLTVSVEACHSKDRGIKSRSFSLFYPKIVIDKSTSQCDLKNLEKRKGKAMEA